MATNEYDADRVEDVLNRRKSGEVPSFNPNTHFIEGVDEALEKRHRARQTHLTSVMDYASRYAPDISAENQRAAQTTGLPIETVESDPQEAARIARLKLMNLQSLMVQSPILAAQLTDPEFAKIAQDDIDNLRYAERLARGETYKVNAEDFNPHADVEAMAGDNFISGSAASGAIGIGVSAMGIGRAVSDVALSHVIDDEEGLVILQPEDNPLAEGFAKSGSRLEKYQELWRPKTDNMITSGIVSGIESSVQNIPFMALGLVSGITKLALGGMTSTVFGQEYQKAREKKLSPEKAFGYAAVQGTIEYLTEMIPMGKFFEEIGKGAGLKRALLAQMPSEMFGEQVATLLQDAMETAALEPDKTWRQYWQERPSAAGETAIATFIGIVSQTAVGHVLQSNIDTHRGIIREQEDVRQEEKRNFFARVSDVAKASKVVSRNRERFESFIQEAAEDAGAPIQEVYIGANTLQQSGVLDQVIEASPSVAEQITTALQTGGDVRIPIGEYAANIAGTDMNNFLMPHIKTIDETGEIGRSIAEYEADEVGPLREAFEQAAQAREDENAFRTSQEAVQQQIVSNLNTLNRWRSEVNENAATLISHYYATRASMLGKTPQQLYEENRVRFTAEPLVGNVYNAAAFATQPPKNWRHVTDTAAAVEMWSGTVNVESIFWTDLDGKLSADFPQFAGYSHSVGRNAISHIRKQHGDAEREIARGQLPITENDISRIPEIITDYDSARDDLSGSNKEPTVAYAKQFDDGVIIYLEGATKKRRNLRAISMWKYPPNVDVKRALDNAVSPDDYVPNAVAAYENNTTGGEYEQSAYRPATNMLPSSITVDGIERPTTNSDGQSIAATTEAVENFWRWFGDSKVVDEQGRPQVVYHGTDADFTVFDLDQARQHSDVPGFFFSNDIEDAGGYGNVGAYYLNISNPADNKPGSNMQGSKVRRELEDAGYDGIIDLNTELENSVGDVINEYVAFHSNQIKSATRNTGEFSSENKSILRQGGDAPRGSFNPDTLTTAFLKGADFSTIVHEGAHAFFEMDINLVTDLLTDKNIEELTDGERRLVDDVSALFKWHGIEGEIADQLNVWYDLDFEERRTFHEKTAVSFERYVMTGTAPSIELIDTFRNFKNWMLRIYQSIKSFIQKNPAAGDLNPGVREIFDRMLATREQIDLARNFRHMMPIFKTAQEAVGFIDNFEQYQEQNAVAIGEAEEELQTRSLRVQAMTTNAHGREMKKIQKRAEATIKSVRAEVETEVRQQPVYNAIAFLTGQENLTGENAKLSIAGLEDMYGGEGDRNALFDWKALSDRRMTAKEGGLHPDVIAERLGYESGDQMIKDILSASPINEVVDAEADARMMEEHGDLLDERAIKAAADEAVHNTSRLRFVLAERNALSKALGDKRMALKAARSVAAEVIDNLRVRDVRPSQYANAETRAAKAAEKAMQSGNLRMAAYEKNNQMLNTCLTREAQQTRDSIDKGVKYLRKFNRDIKSIDRGYQDQIHAILENYELRDLSLKEIDRRQNLKKFLEEREAEGVAPEVPEWLAEESRRTSYRNLTVGEFKGLVAAIQQMEYLGREVNRINFANEKLEREAVIQELLEGIESNATGRSVENRSSYHAKDAAKQLAKGAIAVHLKVSSIARILDGGKDGGAFWNFLIRTANEALDRETTMTAEATEALEEITRPLFKGKSMGGKGTWFPSIGRSMNRQSVIAVALNMGNEGNLQRLLDGEGWRIDQILPVVQTLTAKEWNAIQGVWDYFETYRPAISEKQMRLYGKDLDYVDPKPLTIQAADGQTVTLKGGYYPIVYDPRASTKSASKSVEAETREQLRRAYTSATTRDSFRKARAGEVNDRPLLYNLSGLWNGVQDVIHDLCVHEWLIAVNKIMRSNRLQTAISDNYGIEYVQQIRNWIGDVAAGNRMTAKERAFSMSWLRQGISASGLGFNFWSALQQPFGLTQSVVRVGGKWIGKGISRYFTDYSALTKEINETSEFMRNRSRTYNRELNELRNQMSGYGKFKDNVGRYAYSMMTVTQLIVDRITWAGAYEKAMSEGHDTERAGKLADQAVIDAQGSGMTKDLAAVERSPHTKLFTVFYGFMNTLFNMAAVQTMTETSKAKLAADYLFLFALPCSLIYALKLAITPDDDDEKWDMAKLAKGLAAENLQYLMGTMVIVRELANISSVVSGEGVMSYRGPTGLRLIDDTGKFVTQAARLEFDDAFRKALINLVGDATGLPAAQVNRTITGTKAVVEGKTDGVFEAAAAPVFGFHSKK